MRYFGKASVEICLVLLSFRTVLAFLSYFIPVLFWFTPFIGLVGLVGLVSLVCLVCLVGLVGFIDGWIGDRDFY